MHNFRDLNPFDELAYTGALLVLSRQESGDWNFLPNPPTKDRQKQGESPVSGLGGHLEPHAAWGPERLAFWSRGGPALAEAGMSGLGRDRKIGRFARHQNPINLQLDRAGDGPARPLPPPGGTPGRPPRSGTVGMGPKDGVGWDGA